MVDDRVNWSKLDCSIGPATEVPKHLAALVIGKKAEGAQVSLLCLLLHREHHIVFPATAAAVPRILDIVRAPGADPLSIEAALCLLRDFAIFRSDGHLVSGVPTNPEDLESANCFDRVPALVAEGTDTFLGLLAHDSERVRASAAILAALFARASTPFALEAQRRNETSTRTRASLLIAEGLVARTLHRKLAVDVATSLMALDPLERSAAAIALGLAGAKLSEQAYDALEEAEELEFARDYSFWNEGLLNVYATTVYNL